MTEVRTILWDRNILDITSIRAYYLYVAFKGDVSGSLQGYSTITIDNKGFSVVIYPLSNKHDAYCILKAKDSGLGCDIHVDLRTKHVSVGLNSVLAGSKLVTFIKYMACEAKHLSLKEFMPTLASKLTMDQLENHELSNILSKILKPGMIVHDGEVYKQINNPDYKIIDGKIYEAVQ